MAMPNPNEIAGIIEGKKQQKKKLGSKRVSMSRKKSKEPITLTAQDIKTVKNIAKRCFDQCLKRGHIVKLSEDLNEAVVQTLKRHGYKMTTASKLLSEVLKEFYPEAKLNKGGTEFNLESLNGTLDIIEMINSDPQLKSGEHKLILDSEITSIEYLVYDLMKLNRTQKIITWFNAPKAMEKDRMVVSAKALRWIASSEGQNYFAEANFSMKGAARAGLEFDEILLPDDHDGASLGEEVIADVFQQLGFNVKVLDQKLEIALSKKRRK